MNQPPTTANVIKFSLGFAVGTALQFILFFIAVLGWHGKHAEPHEWLLKFMAWPSSCIDWLRPYFDSASATHLHDLGELLYLVSLMISFIWIPVLCGEISRKYFPSTMLKPRILCKLFIAAMAFACLLAPVFKIKDFLVDQYHTMFRPDFDELISEGNIIVEEAKKYHAIHGKFPEKMPQTQGYRVTDRYGGWQYENRGNHFRLRIGDYSRFEWEVEYSSSAHGERGDGWSVNT
jgi:hypothetical protein